tara:strand:- start:371 stop:601 length:231 start_codon:yes stop_codon:yes gene_type:complete
MKVTKLKKVKCSICNGYIKPLKNKDGKVVWEHGNNAMPINSGRCCDDCEVTKVIPAKLKYSFCINYRGKMRYAKDC